MYSWVSNWNFHLVPQACRWALRADQDWDKFWGRLGNLDGQIDIFNILLAAEKIASGKLTVCDIENGPVEIVDLLMKNGGSFHSFLYTRG